MFITPLDVVNACLATIGEVPLNSLDTDHPYVSAAVKLLRDANARTQAAGWWFNRERITLHPDSNSREIQVPSDILSLDTSNAQNPYVVRGRRLYNMQDSSYEFKDKITVDIIRLLKFEDLPYLAQDVVQAGVLVRFIESYDADESRIRQVRADYQLALAACNTEHIRNTNSNMLNQGGVGAARFRARYPGAQTGRMRTH